MLEIYNLPQLSKNIAVKNNCFKQDNLYASSNNLKQLNGINILSNYNKVSVNKINFKSKCVGLQKEVIKHLKIGNLQFVENNGLRGETLSSKRHKRFIPILKEKGVTAVIDLRNKFTNEHYEEMCTENGLKYFHIPIDSFKLDTSKIIDRLPTLFNVMDNENYYMACALGLHRTDIAQTINFLFNPNKHEVPVMYGHQRAGIFKRDDIMRRIGSIKKEITAEQLKNLGWDNNFEEIYQARKDEYIKLNNEWAKNAYLKSKQN